MSKTENVKVLYACESGSRAWGFASQDSDYDVRFLYRHPRETYLRVFERRDVIEQVDDLLDLSGWDIQKALALLAKSNPALLEWLQSPIVYMQSPKIVHKIREAAARIVSPKSCFYHYLHMAEGNFKDYLNRKTFYIKNTFTPFGHSSPVVGSSARVRCLRLSFKR